jgi:hypothetical protein
MWTAAPSGGGKSKLTITDIPADAQGLYVLVWFEQGIGSAGKPSMSGNAEVKAVEITGTTVVIPLWIWDANYNVSAYEKKENKAVTLLIGSSETASLNNLAGWTEKSLESKSTIPFTNGSASVEASLFFDDGGGDGGSFDSAAFAEYLGTLGTKTAADPNIVEVPAVNISTGGVMKAINDAVLAKKKYVKLDLSACSATGDEISGDYTSGLNDMNVIRDNEYIVGIILPNSLTFIGNGAFIGCTSLASITIPATASVSFSAFWRCSNLRFTVADGSSYSTSEEDKMLIKRNGNDTEVIAYPSASGAFTVPNSVTSIGYGAFADSSILTSVTIPSSVTSIQEQAFQFCDSLVSVTFQGTIGAGNFLEQNTYAPTFPGDLRNKYLAEGGGMGTYTTTNPGENAIWTKQ